LTRPRARGPATKTAASACKSCAKKYISPLVSHFLGDFPAVTKVSLSPGSGPLVNRCGQEYIIACGKVQIKIIKVKTNIILGTVLFKYL